LANLGKFIPIHKGLEWKNLLCQVIPIFSAKILYSKIQRKNLAGNNLLCKEARSIWNYTASFRMECAQINRKSVVASMIIAAQPQTQIKKVECVFIITSDQEHKKGVKFTIFRPHPLE
jgi:hypothetical protein